MTNGNYTAANSYLANAPLVSQIAFRSNTVPRMTTTRSYDFLNRLTDIASSAGAAPVSRSAYAYNTANQRTATTNADNARWVYTYDALGQVTSGKKYWSDGTPVAGQQFEYGFDDIGNRKQTKAGGDENGANLRQASYTNNTLNQITGRGVPGYVEVLGLALATNTVTVNGQSAYRKGEYFRKEWSVNNSSAPVWTNLSVAAPGETTVAGNVLVARTPQTFTHDFDGNLINDGLWTNVWNAENRLLRTESLTSVPAAARAREEWTYLPDGRWIQRIVSTNNGAAYYPAYTNRYVWDGQVLLAILDHTNGLVMSFMRGLDLSGTEQGAGGVGGVLAVNFKTNGTHFCAYDGNGNVTALASAANGSASARYEYGPFGETIRMTGPMAKLNPIRFSTQYADDVTGNVKYLYRDYNPSTGRWPTRDPIEENGGRNVYVFVNNDSISTYDILGESPTWRHLLPQAVFDTLFVQANGLTLAIDDPRFGWIFDDCHNSLFHGNAGGPWNDDWKRWINQMKRNGNAITDDEVIRQLARMIRDLKWKSAFQMGFRVPKNVSYGAGWRAYKKSNECLIKNRIRKRAATMAAKKGSKQGAKSIPVAGWLIAGGCFSFLDICDPQTSLSAAIQSNIPYYGIAYDAYTIYSDLCDQEGASEEMMREMNTGLGYEDLLREFDGSEDKTPTPHYPTP
ncbi:MAG: hypothetical protein KIS67_15580 [Verrucomicrobiae bacterium]|nr:hypothetical protein [Verrucomicrobiae bacterium]